MRCPSCGHCFDAMDTQEFEEVLYTYLDSMGAWTRWVPMKAGSWVEALDHERITSPIQAGMLFHYLRSPYFWDGKPWNKVEVEPTYNGSRRVWKARIHNKEK